jgi:hypothetical protein
MFLTVDILVKVRGIAFHVGLAIRNVNVEVRVRCRIGKCRKHQKAAYEQQGWGQKLGNLLDIHFTLLLQHSKITLKSPKSSKKGSFFYGQTVNKRKIPETIRDFLQNFA